MPLPQVSTEILFPILKEMETDPHWAENSMTQLVLEQPVIAEYLAAQKTEIAKLVGLIVWSFLESQVAADDLKELLG